MFAWLQRLCAALAVAAILALLAVVAINIVARALFDASGGTIALMIPGAIELAQYLLMIAVFAAIPASLQSGMLRVDLVSRHLPPPLNAALDRLWLVLLITVALVLMIRFGGEALTIWERGDVTQDLRVPLWLFYGVACLECLALALLAGASAMGAHTRASPE
ncbi:MAG: TRAP transporter small permease [Pseudomonadota bacterium]